MARLFEFGRGSAKNQAKHGGSCWLCGLFTYFSRRVLLDHCAGAAHLTKTACHDVLPKMNAISAAPRSEWIF
ncbi:hypothetical protein [Marinibacterium sp. SX1]|uniref:hypothetical protein n=1 Tax=Marinibacterium sp. SX1 TaxID=3388424 RepID=UPI003D17D54C